MRRRSRKPWVLALAGVLLLAALLQKGGVPGVQWETRTWGGLELPLPSLLHDATPLFMPDDDGDRVRDDVSRYIHGRFSGAAHAALMQAARAWQYAAIKGDNPRLASRGGWGVSRALSCALSDVVVGKSGMDAERMANHLLDVRDRLFDTEARRAQFARFEAAVAGQAFVVHELNPCDFDPYALPG